MIHAVMKNLGTGDINVENNSTVSQSYTHDYLVITDHTDTPQYIYANAKSKGLPVASSTLLVGTSQKLKVKSINIERWDQNNAKAVPSYNLPKKQQGSYAAWKYQVTYSSDSKQTDISINAGSGTGDAQNFNATVKQYQQTTYLGYACSQNEVPDLFSADLDDKSVVLRNILGDPLSYETVVRNLVISFDFKISSNKIDNYVDAMSKYIGTVNKTDQKIAGIKIYQSMGRLNALSVSKNSQSDDATVHVQIQICVQKPVAFQVFANVSYYAKPKGEDRIVRVCKWTGSQQSMPDDPAVGVVWFDREKGLGHFSKSAFSYGTQFEYYDQKVVLNKDGEFLQAKETAGDVKMTDVGKTYLMTAKVVSWSGLSLPSSVAK